MCGCPQGPGHHRSRHPPRVPSPTLAGASDLSRKLGGFIPTAATVRAPLILAAGGRPSHEVPRGGKGIGPGVRHVLHKRGQSGRPGGDGQAIY